MFADKYIVSISEDSTCRVWNDEGDCIACWEGHAGKNIWSCAVDPEHKMVATGGQDSGILLWSLLSIENNKIDSRDDLNTFVLPKTRGKDSIRNFSLVNETTLVAVTAAGYILKMDTSDPLRVWTEVLYDETLKNYNVMKHSDCGRVIVFGNGYGDLIIMSPTNTFEPIKLNIHKQKVFDIFVTPSLDNNILYIVSTSFNEPLLFHKLDLTDSTAPLFCTLYSLKMPSERTTILCAGFLEQDGLFICGTRESNLILYHLNPTSITDDAPQSVEPSFQLSKAHDNQAITSIIFDQENLLEEEDDDDEKTGFTFWTTGRDGCFNRYRLSPLESSFNMEKVYTNRVTKGLLEGAVLVDGELLLLGFYRKHFFVYNERKNFNVLSIVCGGGHRRWQFDTKDAKLAKAFFGFTNKEGICTYFRDATDEGFKDSILQENYHGREVRAIQFLPLWDQDAPLLFATAGEDTLLRIQQYTPWTCSKFTTLASLRKHTTVIKNINYSKGISTLLFTSGGLEELVCWKIEATLPKASKLAHLNCIELAICPTLSQDIETRIMDTTTHVIDAKRGLHIIGAVYSDATIRFWLFNERTNQFSLAGDGTWHAKCILQIKHIVIHGRLFFFTSATDGRIAFWDLTDSFECVTGQDDFENEPKKAAFRLGEPIYHYSAHMSGVNALEIVPQKDTHHILIVTGGEDNALTASLFSIQQQQIQPIGGIFTIPDAHASSITGIKMIDDSIFTTSTDQRLNMWRINTADSVSLTLINAAYMDVPDPSAIDGVLYNDHIHIAVTGVGLQSVRYHQ
ncbi:WD40 repeat-like protein [Backusella circina FSU 941]|nr:WD40 repeat-like protein [Backusella circina FSU 941]